MQIPLVKPIFNKEMEKAAVDALWNERFVLGESVYKFEEEFARYCGVDYAVSTNSGSDALCIALQALGIGPGQQVVTCPASFVATSNVIIHAGASPLFADIDSDTCTVDPKEITRVVGGKTRGIVPVHLYGYPSDMDSINEIAQAHALVVVEDACQAHGAMFRGRKAGSLGNVGCFSFYPSKNMMVAGDGGILVTNDKKVAYKAAKLRDCGRKGQSVHNDIGYTARLNTLNAAIGRVQLKHLDEWNEKRRKNAAAYDRMLCDLDQLGLPPKGHRDTKPVYHLYVIRTAHRDALRTWLESNGIQCGIHYPLPIHLQPIYKKMLNFGRGMYPKSEELCRTCLSIPMHPDLTQSEVSFVSGKIHEFFR